MDEFAPPRGPSHKTEQKWGPQRGAQRGGLNVVTVVKVQELWLMATLGLVVVKIQYTLTERQKLPAQGVCYSYYYHHLISDIQFCALVILQFLEN